MRINTFHIDPENLELYAMSGLSEHQCIRLEEHLLLCHECQDDLAQVDEFLIAFREAHVSTLEPPVSLTTRLWAALTAFCPNPTRYGIGALAVAALALTVLIPHQTQSLGTYSMQIDATRGQAFAGDRAAPAGYQLNLSLDIRGVPEHETYRVILADETGSPVLSKELVRPPDRLLISTEAPLQGGDYWIRIVTPTNPHILLREFALNVK